MECIGLGLDVSKGRADIAIINQSGTQLEGSGGYDDTHAGHERLRGVLRDLRRRYPEATLIAGVESTAGYERTWVGLFKRERQAGREVTIHRLNPLVVKRFLGTELHRKIDDRQAAMGIARFLLERLRERPAHEIPLDGRVVFYRQIRGLIQHRVEQRQRFQNLLSATNPELVQFCREGVPDWVLAVCAAYPTAPQLARAKPTKLADLPHVGQAKAERLIAAAKTSTAALTDAGTMAAMHMLVTEIRGLDARIEAGQQALEAMLSDDPRVALLDGIPGIGMWSAIALVLEIGDVSRFSDVRQLIAWSGLDPREEESGDGVIRRGISHRGNAYLRAILFPLAMAAMLHNPIVGAFIAKKRSEGKPGKVALVAASAKILRIAYAILVSGKPYDPQHEATRAKPAAASRQQARAIEPPAETPAVQPDLKAPITAKEARRRKAAIAHATAPQSQANEVGPQPGPGASAATASPPTTRSQVPT